MKHPPTLLSEACAAAAYNYTAVTPAARIELSGRAVVMKLFFDRLLKCLSAHPPRLKCMTNG